MRLDQIEQAAAATRAGAVALALSLLGTGSVIHAGGATAAATLASIGMSLAAAALARSLLPREE